jgi:hypothetical protein
MSPRGASRWPHPLRRSPRLNEQVVQQLILGAAAAMTAHIELVFDVPLLADDD